MGFLRLAMQNFPIVRLQCNAMQCWTVVASLLSHFLLCTMYNAVMGFPNAVKHSNRIAQHISLECWFSTFALQCGPHLSKRLVPKSCKAIEKVLGFLHLAMHNSSIVLTCIWLQCNDPKYLVFSCLIHQLYMNCIPIIGSRNIPYIVGVFVDGPLARLNP